MAKRKTPRKPRKGRASEQSITESGLCIYKKDDQIKTLTNKRWDVASESVEGKWYRVSFDGNRPTCECAYHTTGNGCRCKHVAAIEHLILSETKSDCSEVDDKEELISTPVQECPKCHNKKFVRNGWYTGKSGKKQRYKCRECNHGFRDNLGFEYRHTSSMYITLCLLYGAGLSVASLQHMLSHIIHHCIYKYHYQMVGALHRHGGEVYGLDTPARFGKQTECGRETPRYPGQGELYGNDNGYGHPVHTGMRGLAH